MGYDRRGRGKWPAVMVLTPLMAGRLDEGLRGGIKVGGESRRGVKTSLGIPRLEVGRRGVAGGDGKKRQWLTDVGKGMKLTDGPHMAVT
jgi:hypothetical protein